VSIVSPGVIMGEAYIHIGFGKTGSSAIQSFLGNNRKELSKNGWGVFLANDLPHWVTLSHDAGYNKGELYPECLDIYNKLVRPGNLNQELIDYFYKEIRTTILSKNYENTIISLEQILDLPYLPQINKRLDVLEEILRSLESRYNINIILYCRRQDKWIESLYYQAWKPGLYSMPFNEYLRCFEPFCLKNKNDNVDGSRSLFNLNWADYGVLLKERFPNYIISVISYDKCIKEGGLLKNFAYLTNIKEYNLNYDIPRENVSMNTLGLRIMQEANFLENIHREFLFFYLTEECDFEKTAGNKDSLFDDLQKKEIYDYYSKSNKELFHLDDDLYRELFYPKENELKNYEEEMIKILLKEFISCNISSIKYSNWKIRIKIRIMKKKARDHILRIIIAFKQPKLAYAHIIKKMIP